MEQVYTIAYRVAQLEPSRKCFWFKLLRVVKAAKMVHDLYGELEGSCCIYTTLSLCKRSVQGRGDTQLYVGENTLTKQHVTVISTSAGSVFWEQKSAKRKDPVL